MNAYNRIFQICSDCWAAALWRRCVGRRSWIYLFIQAHVKPLILNEKVKTRSASKLHDALLAKTFSCERHQIHINHFVFWILLASREFTSSIGFSFLIRYSIAVANTWIFFTQHTVQPNNIWESSESAQLYTLVGYSNCENAHIDTNNKRINTAAHKRRVELIACDTLSVVCVDACNLILTVAVAS